MLAILAEKITFDRVTKRKRSEFCKRYNSDYKANANIPVWQPKPADNDECTVPKYNKTIDDDYGIRTLNLLRWATGFENTVTIDDRYHKSQCDCAIFLYHYQGLTHEPPKDGKCYSENATIGCGSSNLAAGYGSAAETVMGYYHDLGVDSLGHRTWDLSISMQRTSFCGIGIWSAMKVFDLVDKDWIRGGSGTLPFKASPPPGPIELPFIPTDWSFIANDMCMKPKITTKQNGTVVSQIEKKMFPPMYHWVPNITIAYNTTYDVEIDCGNYTYSYASYTTNCSQNIEDIEFDRQMKRQSVGVYWQFAVNYAIAAVTIAVVVALIVIISLSIAKQKKGGEDTEKDRSTVNHSVV